MNCEYCGLDPYEYVSAGIDMVPVAVNCCEAGIMAYDYGWSYRRIKWEFRRQRLLAWISQFSGSEEMKNRLLYAWYILRSLAKLRRPMYYDFWRFEMVKYGYVDVAHDR